MQIKEIQEFSEVRYEARAYMCYLFTRNIPNNLPGVSLELINSAFKKMADEIDEIDAFYILDKNGIQLEDNFTNNNDYRVGKGENRANKAYYYRAVKEKRCILTDPYPSVLTNDLCVTASFPVYDDKKELKYIACADIALENILKITNPSSINGIFGKFIKLMYSFFAMALFCVCLFLLILGIKSLIVKDLSSLSVASMFESTIILTLALAIFDLVKAIFESEVLGHSKDEDGNSKTMMKFIASIIIALAIESLMLVFKFSITDPSHVIYAVYLIAGVALLIISLGFYIFVKNRDK